MSALEFLDEQHRQGSLRDVREAIKTEDGSVGDTVAALSAGDNYGKAECVLHILNAFNMAKMKQTGNCLWTIDDLRAWGFAVRALGTSWEITAQAQEAIKGKRK